MSRPTNKTRVLFLCTGNSCRSQMAEGLLRELAGDQYEASSAGVSPTQVNAMAVRVMAEVAVDISGQRSKSVDDMTGREFDYVITVCDKAREACPIFSSAGRQLHWGFEDPAQAVGTEEERLHAFRKVRDAISERLRHFIGTPSIQSSRS